MFDTFNGLPVHPLVVHAVVVLLPLAIVGTIVIALRPRWRVPYGPLVVGAALVATVLSPIATSSGESLEELVGDPGEHAELGEQLIWFSVALLLASAALVVLQWRADRADRTTSDSASVVEHDAETAPQRPDQSRVLVVVAGVAVVAALACGVQVYRVGDSGAKAAWGDVGASGR